MGVVVEASVRRPDAVGLLPVARLARNSCSVLRQPTVQSTNVRKRFGAPGFREVCFSGAAEDVVTQSTRSRRRANVWFGFYGIRSDSRRCRCRSVGYARKSRAGSRNVDVRVQHAIARFWGAHAVSVRSPEQIKTSAKLFAESPAELCARVFTVEFRDETGANLGRTHCFALVSVGAITKSLVVHYLYHFQHASLAFRSALRQKR